MADPDPVAGLRPGMRAVVRHRIGHGLEHDLSEPGLTDALGDVVAIDADTVSVRTRRGLVVIDRTAVVAAKEVPPRPTRRGAPHLAISMDDLERVMVEGWPPLERAELGDWLLRAAAGFTGRANSVLPLGNPGVPLTEAVDRCERWYDERGLPRLFTLFGPAGFAVDDDPLGRELLGRGYGPFNNTLVLTAATSALPAETPHASGARVRLEPELSQRWWDSCAERARAAELHVPSEVARAVLTGSTEQLFASLEVDGAVVAVARVAFAQSWAGVSAVLVSPEHRREGVAGQLMAAMTGAAQTRGIRSLHLEVMRSNSGARNLYQRLGFSVHHEYVRLGA